VEDQRERASDIRRRNEALVYNILPPHVAAHFMGSRKRQHEELYSQSYAEVGVLFASMPNFSGMHQLILNSLKLHLEECCPQMSEKCKHLLKKFTYQGM
jgi:hypothetical protein